MSTKLYNILMSAGGNIMLIFLGLTPYIIFSIGRKFDKLFINRKHYLNPEIVGLNQYCRAISYTLCIVLNKTYQKNDYLQSLYQEFSFRSHASRTQITIGTIFLLLFAVGVSFSIFAIFIKFLVN